MHSVRRSSQYQSSSILFLYRPGFCLSSLVNSLLRSTTPRNDVQPDKNGKNHHRFKLRIHPLIDTNRALYYAMYGEQQPRPSNNEQKPYANQSLVKEKASLSVGMVTSANRHLDSTYLTRREITK